MASPRTMYVPPPRRHSVVGPLILITIGALFLLRNFGYTIPLFHNFVKYWPLLLILIGLVRLAEFFAARSAQRPVPAMGGGTIFLLVLVIAVGAGLTAAFHGRNNIDWGSVRDNVDVDDDLLHLFGNQYTYDGELTQELPAGGTVRVTCDRGNITVNNWDQPQVKLVYHKRVFAGSQGEADSTNRSTTPRIQVQGRIVDVQGNTESAGPKGVASDIEVYVPVKADLEVSVRRGDVSVSQRTGDVKVNSERGDVTVDQVTGNINVATKHGSLHASNVTGNLAADGRLDDLALDSISGTVFVTADIFGDTRLSKLQKGVTIRTSRTDLQFAKLEGDLTMDSGDLQGDGLLGPITLSTKAKDVNLRNLKGDVHITNDRGDITLETSAAAPLGNLDLTTHHGDVHLRLPPKANFQYQVVTRHGDISSDFENVRSESHTGTSAASGTVGKGGVKINVTADTGDIEISKADGSMPEPPEPPAKPPKPQKAGKKVGDVEVM
ncbi:MAG TPA: DUF4097 family beta strand repeat-containing protein [Candidatus Saccharimonadales bacterium]|nr:DUF4097 family beta strand repeat-containing protein [Candidatus Saccharimonadales bacterium]